MSSLESIKEFNEARQQRAELVPFDTPVALAEYLTGKDRNLADKDAIYRALVEMAQAEGKIGLAMTLLWLGLRPGLNRVYGRLAKGYSWNLKNPRNRNTVASEIWSQFVDVVLGAELDRIRRVAPNLVHSTKREAKKMDAWDKRQAELPEGNELGPAGHPPVDISDLGLAPGLAPDHQVTRLRAMIADLTSDDNADLVSGVVFFGDDQQELSKRLGLTYDVTRKRYQRGIKQLQKKMRKRCPKSTLSSAFTF